MVHLVSRKVSHRDGRAIYRLWCTCGEWTHDTDSKETADKVSQGHTEHPRPSLDLETLWNTPLWPLDDNV